MTRLTTVLTTALALAGIGFAAPLAQAETLRIATEGAYEPFNFVEPASFRASTSTSPRRCAPRWRWSARSPPRPGTG